MVYWLTIMTLELHYPMIQFLMITGYPTHTMEYPTSHLFFSKYSQEPFLYHAVENTVQWPKQLRNARWEGCVQHREYTAVFN